MNVKMFCILCLCIILCDTSKASENLTFVLKQSLILSSAFVSVIIICCCDVPEEVSVSFDPEVDLNDDAIGRSRYERFYSVRSNYARENLSIRRRSREPSRVGCL